MPTAASWSSLAPTEAPARSEASSESAAISPESIALLAISVALTESVARSHAVSDSLTTLAELTASLARSAWAIGGVEDLRAVDRVGGEVGDP